MAKNAYFQIVHKPKRTMIKVIPPSEGGEMFSLDEVQQYLDAVNITSETGGIRQRISSSYDGNTSGR